MEIYAFYLMTSAALLKKEVSVKLLSGEAYVLVLPSLRLLLLFICLYMQLTSNKIILNYNFKCYEVHRGYVI